MIPSQSFILDVFITCPGFAMPLHYTERPDRENREWQKWVQNYYFLGWISMSSMKNPEMDKQTSISGAFRIKNGHNRKFSS